MFEPRYYAYVYRDPRDDEPFYVGKGKGDRANIHLKGCSTNKQLRTFLRNMRDGAPEIELIHTSSEIAAYWLERMLIAAYGRKDNHTGPLFNHTDGGEGSTGRKGKVFTEAELKKISHGVRRSMTPEVLEKKRLAGLKGTQRSAELGLNKLGGVHAGAFQKGHKNWLGRCHRPETIEKMRAYRLAHPVVRKELKTPLESSV